jgi:hypothetical protein
MRKIQVLLALIAVAFWVLTMGLAFAEDGKAEGQPFQYLQQQIDELKAQIQGIKSTSVGNIAVYDANDNFLGICHAEGWGTYLDIYVPSLNTFARIENLEPGGTVNIHSFWPVYFNPSGTPYVRTQAWMQRLMGCGTTADRYFLGTGNEMTITAVSVKQDCSQTTLPSPLQVKVYETLEIPEEDIPFPLPIAMPIKFKYVRQNPPTN